MLTKNIKIKLIFILSFMILYGIMLKMNEKDRKIEINKELEIVSKTFKASFFAVENENHIDATTTSTIMHQDEVVIAIMDKVRDATNESKDEIRTKLQKHLEPLYQMLKNEGVISFQIVLPNNESFLRMHKIDEFGDNISFTRYTFKNVNDTRKAISGVEYGNDNLNYRYVFPFHNFDGLYLGAFEISYSVKYMQDLMENIDKIKTDFLLKDDKFKKNGWEYKYKSIESNREKGEDFISYIEDDNHIKVATFFSLKNVEDNKTLAYLVSYTNNEYIKNIIKRYDDKNIITFFIFLIISILLYKVILHQRNIREELENKVIERTEKIEQKSKELKKINKNIKDSIEYASIIQQAILPSTDILDNYTKENFVFWKPKDIVGGDIYFVVELDSKEEVLVMVIDGAGHGVPGAFVTMLVKAIETQIVSRIKEGILEPSPAKILEYFNRSIKTMLKQKKGSKSNAGFDGGILYYNKTTNECKYAGAKTDLYIIDDNNLNIINGDRKNVGFVRTKIDQKYTEHIVTVKKDTKLYLTTDGIFDQEGKSKIRYGIDKFESEIIKINKQSFLVQKNLIIDSFNNFKQTIKQTDDITIIGLKF